MLYRQAHFLLVFKYMYFVLCHTVLNKLSLIMMYFVISVLKTIYNTLSYFKIYASETQYGLLTRFC